MSDVFLPIAERPKLDTLTREERIREKLKFFNLEKESLDQSRKRIAYKVRQMSTRFGSRHANMVCVEGEQKNPFEEMMAIEAEFGSIFESKEQAARDIGRQNSRWYPLFEQLTQKDKYQQFKEIVATFQTRKALHLATKPLDMFKMQISQRIKLAAKMEGEGGHTTSTKIDVQRMIAEEQRRQ